jgi:hypothetical protein
VGGGKKYSQVHLVVEVWEAEMMREWIENERSVRVG